MAVENIRGAIEAILFANGASVEFSRIAQALEISEKKVKEHISALIDDYEASGRGITIILLDNSCQMVSKKEFAPQIRTVMDLRRNTPLSQAALEVLAVVAYNQPVTKAFVEQVRGVDCSGVIGSLTTKGLVEEKGRLELPGRPLLYGTTENFLRCFKALWTAHWITLPTCRTVPTWTSWPSPTTPTISTPRITPTWNPPCMIPPW